MRPIELSEAIAAYKMGNFETALELYIIALKDQPQNATIHHNISILLAIQGDMEGSLSYIKRAIEIDSSISQIRDTFFKIAKSTGNEELIKEYLSQDILKSINGKNKLITKTEIQKSNQVRRVVPQYIFGDLHNLYKKGKFKDVLEKADTLLKTYGNSSKIINISACANLQLRQYEQAIKKFDWLIANGLDDPMTFNNIGSTYLQMNKFQEASHYLTSAIEKDPGYKEALYNMGMLKRKTGHVDEAILLFQKVIQEQPNYSNAKLSLAEICQTTGQIEHAEKIYMELLDDGQKSSNILNNLALCYKNKGKLNLARKTLEEAIAFYSNDSSLHYNLSSVKIYKRKDKQLYQMIELFSKVSSNDPRYTDFAFAIGKAMDDIGDYTTAFEFFSMGNQSIQNELAHDVSIDQTLFQMIKQDFDIQHNKVANVQQSSPSYSNIPIFIVGLPRSGSTLIEQMISSHSNVYGAGELPFVTDILNSNKIVGKGFDHHSEFQFRELYLKKITMLGQNEKYISDKMPLNFRFLGYILKAMPFAKVIHINRNHNDLCWSIFRHRFSSNTNAYSYDLKNVIKYHEIYLSLMNFWKEKFPNKIYDLQYEKLVIEPEKQCKKIFSFLDLEWEASCLEFHKNQRHVFTNSSVQVRKGLNTTGVGKWLNYKNFLPQEFS